MRIVIVDQDVAFREALVSQLGQRKFDAFGVGDAASLYRDLLIRSCDTVVIDPALPGEDGFAVAHFLSGLNRTGIVMLCERPAAKLSDALPARGVDAFLPKPVHLHELIVTLKSISPRKKQVRPQAMPPTDAPGCWTLVTHGWQLIAPDGARISLTSYEYSLMLLLFQRNGAAVSRVEIVSTFGLDYQFYDERRLEAIVSRLRRKLDPHLGRSKPLQTAHGFGYAFTAPARICFHLSVPAASGSADSTSIDEDMTPLARLSDTCAM
ncbi:response regulator transcription factor [Paraburkholderia phosphatilytica]|uniref:response regulator transcription factor n=1 Tax=Paraburkholderia phosphatilytica TaxID=2282883 RepID=UPI000E4F3D15|nr:response regulator transcription factor [Paraburkholderia phosphatilytica]